MRAQGPPSSFSHEGSSRVRYPGERELLTCLEIGKAITSTFDMEEIVETILERISQLVPAKNWSLLLLDEAKGELFFQVAVGLDERITREIRIALGEGVAGTVALTGEPLAVKDVEGDPRFTSKVDALSGFRTRSLICLPLKLRGRTLGVVEIVNPVDPSLFEEPQMTLLSILADYLAIAIGNSLNYKRLASMALMDTVTNHYNTRFLHQFLDELTSGEDRTVSLVFMDMDDFKKIVDTHGHLAGSKVLKEVADAMASLLSANDFLVRYGGDEFVIVMDRCPKREAVAKVEELRRMLSSRRFLEGDGLSVNVSASFGVASYPEDAKTKEGLLRLADECMFRSKETGKGKITVQGNAP
jgi:diguanylate cyclase (GGDEF)-like protein